MQTLLHRIYVCMNVSTASTPYTMQLRTVVRLPEVNKRPVKPYLTLLRLGLCRRARLEVRRRARRCEHERVGADCLEAIVFPQADDAPDKHVHAEARQDRMNRRPIRQRGSVSQDGNPGESALRTSLSPQALG